MTIHLKNILQLLQLTLFLLNLRVRLRVYLAEQKSCYVQYLLQLLRSLKLDMTKLVAIIFFKYLKKSARRTSEKPLDEAHAHTLKGPLFRHEHKD